MKKLSLFLIALAMLLVSCKPESEKPTVVTKSVGEVTETTAKVVGQVTADGGAEVTERGVCWNTTTAPEVIDYRMKDVEGGLGIFTLNIPDLVPNTQYYVRAYATNEKGVSYGEEMTLTTLKEIELPTVTTAEVEDITETTAVSGGEVTSDGGGEVTARGICWSTKQNPTIEDNKTTNGKGVGSFTSQIPDLVPNTQYYVRAYATNEKGIAYGEEMTFTTKKEVELPTVTTAKVKDITETTAVSGGEVASDGGGEVTARGICWSTKQNPTIEDNKTTNGSGVGSFTSQIPDLVPNTQYYVRAYATNEVGTAYGKEVTFTTLDKLLPTVTTTEVTDITVYSAKCGGEVTFDGNLATTRGVCWSTSQNPTIEDNKTTEGYGVGSFTSQIPYLVPATQYYVRAYATNEVGTAYGEEVTFTTLVDANGREYVDLGLSVKWATCNIGANTPEEYGDYFAWGETSTKETYTEDNCPTDGLSKSELQSQGYIDGEGNLTAQYDAATANWGGSWRMPTKAEYNELLNNCTWTLTTQNGVKGYKVKGPSGASIFLPAAGNRYGSSLYSAGSYGYCWSSTPYDDSAYYLDFYSVNHGMNFSSRYYGQSVRPVLE